MVFLLDRIRHIVICGPGNRTSHVSAVLRPHIAAVTLAAYECESLNFPEPPLPRRDNMFDWRPCVGGRGPLRELPPYFMARAARLSGIDPDDEDDDLKEFEELKRKQSNKTELTLIEKGKLFVEELVQRVGFLESWHSESAVRPGRDNLRSFLGAIFDIFRGHLIGKAIIKMHIQKLFVIIAFNETLIVTALQWLKYIPVVGDKLQVPFKDSSLTDKNRNCIKAGAWESRVGTYWVRFLKSLWSP
ncbi:hypothetical protein MTP99_013889 [Tenebrio molitor]|nr:hypothetical protein MTP99_013889 [Tenebrio molitor]